MGYEKRKVHIEFKAPDCVQITNIYFQKTFYLKNECVVDLFNLKKIEVKNLDELSVQSKVDSSFFVCFYHHQHDDDSCNELDCAGDEWYGMVVLRPGKDKIEMLEDEEDIVTLKNNNKSYSGAVWVDE